MKPFSGRGERDTPAASVYFASEKWKIAGLSALGLFVAQVEALSLVMLVPLAQSIAEGKEQVARKVGGVDFHGSIGVFFAIAIGLMAAALIGNLVTSYLQSNLTTNWEARRREESIHAYIAADYPTQRAERAGTLPTVAGYITMGTRALGALIQAIRAGLSVAVFLVIALLLDVRAALTLLIVGLVISAMLRPLSNQVKPLSRRLSKLQRTFASELTETEGLVRELRIFDAWPARFKTIKVSIDETARLRRRVNFLGAVVGSSYQYLGIMMVLGALYAARSFALIELSVLGATALLLLRGVSYGQMLQTNRHTIIDSMQSIVKLEEIESVYRAHPEHTGGETLGPVETLECQDLVYSYGDDTFAVDHVNFAARQGEIIGIVGPSGSGKSTLSQLLLRLRRPLNGTIKVNGIDADDLSLASWYERVTLVPQDPHLFHGTVRDNISLFNDEVDLDTITEAAKAAGIHEVIRSLPHGYDTDIGASTRDLSGGQIQRIGIARALARGADVLVLDEPSSALDVHSEALVQETLRSLGGTKLVFIIAHRLSTLSICDRLLVLHEGRVESDGTLSHVIETSPFFRRAMDAGTLDIGSPT